MGKYVCREQPKIFQHQEDSCQVLGSMNGMVNTLSLPFVVSPLAIDLELGINLPQR